MGFTATPRKELERCSPEALRFAEAYAAGVNAGIEKSGIPLEFVLTSYRPEPWSAIDTLATIRVMTYVGLGQTQQDFEKLLVEAIRGGVPLDRLKKLVAPHLDGLDDDTVEAIRALREVQPLMPPEVRFHPGMAGPKASNNWAVAGNRSATGTALYCSDPHMEVNRLPAIWYEVVAHLPDDLRIGMTMPGVPGLIMGRTRDLAFSFSYGFMDMVDYFIEEVSDGKCRRGDSFVPFEIHHETITRKADDPVILTIRENNLGVLETDPTTAALHDGLYLTRAWSAQRNGAAASLEAMYRLPAARTVPKAQEVLRDVTISCNWVLADSDGNIGYQQSGRAPARRHSGLYPVPAWDETLAWEGWVPTRDLHQHSQPGGGVHRDRQPGDQPSRRSRGGQSAHGVLPRRSHPQRPGGDGQGHDRRHEASPARSVLAPRRKTPGRPRSGAARRAGQPGVAGMGPPVRSRLAGGDYF